MSEAAGYPEILSDMLDKIAELLVKEGAAPGRERAIAFGVTELLRRDWGGRDGFYIPRGVSFEREQMKRMIHEHWDGSNTDALRALLDIGESYLRKLYAEAVAERLRRKT